MAAALLAIIAIPLIGIFWGGYVLSVLWSWFIVPTLGAPSITYLQAAGLTIVVNTFLGRRGHDADMKANQGKSGDEKVIEAITMALAFPAIALAVGWIVHSFM